MTIYPNTYSAEIKDENDERENFKNSITVIFKESREAERRSHTKKP